MFGIIIAVILVILFLALPMWAIHESLSVSKSIAYIDALKIVIPYCKEQLLMNEVPYVVRELTSNSRYITFRELTSLDSNSLKSEYLKILYGGAYDNHPCANARFRFLYYLIVCITEIDHQIWADKSEINVDTIDVDNAMMTLINIEPETYAQLPQYMVILHDVVHKYKDGKIQEIYGISFSNFWYGHKFTKNDDIENNTVALLREILM